ncbi:MAG: hypothetical protein ISS19_04880 [Bacteroidales bacterium]|nr:hypothetical protein [Bacteroidales bacterium]
MKRFFLVLFSLVLILAVQCNDPEPEPKPEPFNIDLVVDGQIIIEVNPYGICPLVALATFETTEDVSVTIKVLG